MTPIWCHTFSFSYPSLHTTHGGMKFQILLERSLIILYRGCSKSLKLPIISHKIQKVVLKNSSWDIWERAQNSWLVLLVVNVYLLVALILFGIRPNESRACLTSQIGLSVQYKNSKSYHTFPTKTKQNQHVCHEIENLIWLGVFKQTLREIKLTYIENHDNLIQKINFQCNLSCTFWLALSDHVYSTI